LHQPIFTDIFSKPKSSHPNRKEDAKLGALNSITATICQNSQQNAETSRKECIPPKLSNLNHPSFPKHLDEFVSLLFADSNPETHSIPTQSNNNIKPTSKLEFHFSHKRKKRKPK